MTGYELKVEDDCTDNMCRNLYRLKDNTKLGQLWWDLTRFPHFTAENVTLEEADLRFIVKCIDDVYAQM